MFSGWNKVDGNITENLTVSGSWSYEKTDVATYNVGYDWTGLPAGRKLYTEAGVETTPKLPSSITGLVNNEPYGDRVDKLMPGTEVYTHDEYGNQDGKYTLGDWAVPNEGVMGEADQTVSGKWAYEKVEVPEWRITYGWTGSVPEGVDMPETPAGHTEPQDPKAYKNNDAYKVDTVYTAGYTVLNYDAYRNVN